MEDTPKEIFQSTSTKPIPNILTAQKQRDGSWLVKSVTVDGVVNTLIIPAQK